MRIIGGKTVDISDEEYKYYNELVKHFGSECFEDLFEVDNDGFISIITPIKNIPWSVLFFSQQVMVNQRLRIIDEFRQNRRKNE